MRQIDREVVHQMRKGERKGRRPKRGGGAHRLVGDELVTAAEEMNFGEQSRDLERARERGEK